MCALACIMSSYQRDTQMYIPPQIFSYLRKQMTSANFTTLFFSSAQSKSLTEQMSATFPYSKTACQ